MRRAVQDHSPVGHLPEVGRTSELHGGGTAVKSYTNIRDVSRGELAAIENGTGGILHLSPDEGWPSATSSRRSARLGKDFEAATRSVEERLGQDRLHDRLLARPARPRLDARDRLGRASRRSSTGSSDIGTRSSCKPWEYVHKP